MSQLNISVGILSWGSPKTLRNTLISYVQSGLFSLTDDVIIYFQEVTDQDLTIAAEFGITKILSSDNNIGIGKAFAALANAAAHEYILLLENDWVNIVDNIDIVYTELHLGQYALDKGIVDAVRYRHRSNPGDPLYTRQFAGREMVSPAHLGDAHHWIVNPHEIYPEQFKWMAISANGNFYTIPSSFCCFTNNPCLWKKQFYLDKIAPFAGDGVALEGAIQTWWEEQKFKVGLCGGMFTHLRLDR